MQTVCVKSTENRNYFDGTQVSNCKIWLIVPLIYSKKIDPIIESFDMEDMSSRDRLIENLLIPANIGSSSHFHIGISWIVTSTSVTIDIHRFVIVVQNWLDCDLISIRRVVIEASHASLLGWSTIIIRFLRCVYLFEFFIFFCLLLIFV